jgi:hypothetical protein
MVPWKLPSKVTLSIRKLGQVDELHVPCTATGEVMELVPIPLCATIFMHEMRDSELPEVGCSKNMLPPEVRSSVMTVAVQDEDAPVVLAPLCGVPVPLMVMPMPLGTVTPVVQVHVPEGRLIVSPLTAVCVGPLITAFTALWLQEAAV